MRLVEGSRWSEDARGTNAIGTAIAERQPVAVLGRAHYEDRNHGLFCYATPMPDAYGDVVGVLDVTGALRGARSRGGRRGAGRRRGARAGPPRCARTLEPPPAGLPRSERMLHRTARAGAPRRGERRWSVAMNGAARAAARGLRREGAPLTVERVFGIVYAKPVRAVALSGGGGARFETRDVNAIASSSSRCSEPRGASSPCSPTGARPPGRRCPPRMLRYRHPRSRWGLPRPSPRAPRRSTPSSGPTPSVVDAKELAARFAPTAIPVLLLAETGTGKELFARAIHAASPRAAGAVRRAQLRRARAQRCSRASFSATRRGPSPAPPHRIRGQDRRGARGNALPRRDRRDAGAAPGRCSCACSRTARYHRVGESPASPLRFPPRLRDVPRSAGARRRRAGSGATSSTASRAPA